MGTFVYEAFRANGERVSGEVEAKTRTEAYSLLDKERLQPISLQQRAEEAETAPSQPDREDQPLGPVPLSQSQVIFFTEEVSDLLDAGLQLESALRVIESRQERSALKRVASTLRQRVRDGESFSSALRASSKSFGDLYCNLVAAGEASGALSQILNRQVKYLTTMQELRNRVIQALIYPSFIFGTGILLMVLFMVVLVPQLTSLFEKSERQMPLVTRVLIGTSTFFADYWWLLLLAVAGIVFGSWLLLRQPLGREWWDRVSLKLPVVGGIIQSRFLAQFSQTLSNLVANGLPLLTGLTLMEKATTNQFLRNRLTEVVAIVAEGGLLSSALRRVGGFPGIFIDLLGVGEQTGQIAASLEKAAVRYEKEMDRRIDQMTALIQPVVIIGIALVIGTVVYSIVTSIFQATSTLRVR